MFVKCAKLEQEKDPSDTSLISEKGDKMSWPIRFEGLNQCDDLTNAYLPGHYLTNTISPYILLSSPINITN